MARDITATNLRLALLDQKVAGAFTGKAYAYVSVYGDEGWTLGIAVANEEGYSPIKGFPLKDHQEAKTTAQGMNDHLGLVSHRIADIIASTMRGYRFPKLCGCASCRPKESGEPRPIKPDGGHMDGGAQVTNPKPAPIMPPAPVALSLED